MLKKCDELSGYSIFVDKVREYSEAIPDAKSAFKKAIDDCIEHDVLRDFLKSHLSEVLNMLLAEWKNVKWGEVQREEGREEKAREDAKNLLALGVSPETVAKGVGLDMETVKKLSAE
ncbi:conserved hypothetical protein [Treponema primitia ZAS-2]|uniref:Transposase n=1 Tax=Treponema primitia (strain ATCC BAA-887 / DSM 12427 / ZAS-2) TaxID=545694 RepID=F5YQ68_TREPZ|nr:hypothetical protein [Treponema primitia]AEF86288.1 conserved hypothetical protein [Treponema primitia ZAS-2]